MMNIRKIAKKIEKQRDMKTKEYYRGYNSAKEVINKGEDPQELFNQSHNSMNFTDFDKGWQKACEEFGANSNDLF